MAGLPEPRKDHAVVMVKFARDCREKFNEVSRNLEVTLGPDTGDLGMRFGLHSGPVTAGVLRRRSSRFRCFGDVSCCSYFVFVVSSFYFVSMSTEPFHPYDRRFRFLLLEWSLTD